MNTELTDSPPIAPAPISPTRPFFWSVRRELWENRSIYLAPLIAAGVVLFGFGLTAFGLPQLRRNALALESVRQRAAIEMPYDGAAMMIMFTVFIVGIVYCLDALYGERRDRSILFWKSLPVSDITSVLSKAIVPLAILPLLTFVIVLATSGGHDLATAALASALADAPLRSGDKRPLGGAHLRLAAPGFRLGQARDVPLGRAAVARNQRD
jgi:hypothetical protein